MDVRKLGPFSRLGDAQVIQIFGFLCVQDRSRLRCTSRRFKALIDHQFSITELLVCPDQLVSGLDRTKRLLDCFASSSTAEMFEILGFKFKSSRLLTVDALFRRLTSLEPEIFGGKLRFGRAG